MESVQWENGIITIPPTGNPVAALDQAGKEGWEAWVIISADQNGMQIGVKRHKRAITLATEMPNGNGLVR